MRFHEKRKFKMNQAMAKRYLTSFFSRKQINMHIITTICQRTFVRVVSGAHL
jgi:hypothetical protein